MPEAADPVESRVAQCAADDSGVDAQLLGGFLRIVTDAAASGRRLTRAELDACAETGRRAAELGTPPRALVDLYLSATWRLWRDSPTLSQGEAARVRASALAVLRAADDGVAAVIGGLQQARADLIRLREATRHDTLDGLLAGGAEAVAAAAGADELGMDLAGRVAVLVAVGARRWGDPATAALPTRVERALAGRLADDHPLVLLRDGRLVAVFAAPDSAAVLAVNAAVGTVLDEYLPARDGEARGWRAAVSAARAGPESVRASYREALEALELSRRAGLSEPVVDARELALFRVLVRDRQAALDLVTSTLSPLVDARGAESLLATLRTYFLTGAVAPETAARLHLSVRAVTYRLSRIADLIGRDPTDPAQRLQLQAAVTAADLLGWPGAGDASEP
jgi:sugar diacid utilization regulator